MEELNNIIKEVLAKKKRNKFTFLTGAGISVESGIPTYRGDDGIWIKGSTYYKPEEFGTYQYFMKHPEEVWEFSLFWKTRAANSSPNSSHFILAELETRLEDRFHLITQNVDNLHKRAGNNNIFEIHGNYREVKCAGSCKQILDFPKNMREKQYNEPLTPEEIEVLHCPECGEWLRPNVLMFDEDYDEKTNKWLSALRIAKETGILFILGTSGATNLPIKIAETTLKYGGYVFDINPQDNQFTTLIKNKKNGRVIRAESTAILTKIRTIFEANTPDN